MRHAALGLFVFGSLYAPPTAAEPWVCTFTTTCMASVDCIDQDNRARVIAADHEGQLFLEWDGVPLLAAPIPGGTGYVAGNADMNVLLSNPGPLTYLTVHDAAVTAYFGSCEDLGS